MSSSSGGGGVKGGNNNNRYDGFTTNAEDIAQAAAIQAKLRQQASTTNTTSTVLQRLPSVEIASGVHKYVLIQAALRSNENGQEEQYIVTSRRHAAYHRDAAEPMIAALERAGYTNIDVTGGGRIDCNEERKSMKIFGFSYGFGLADHAISQRVVAEDPRYADFDITISNEGY